MEVGLEPHLVINQITDNSLNNNSCMSVTRNTQLRLELKGSVLSVLYSTILQMVHGVRVRALMYCATIISDA